MRDDLLMMMIADLIKSYSFDAVYDAVMLIGGEDNERDISVGLFMLSKNQYNAIANLISNQDKISAIKLYRAFTLCTLRYAKEIVEKTSW